MSKKKMECKYHRCNGSVEEVKKGDDFRTRQHKQEGFCSDECRDDYYSEWGDYYEQGQTY